MLWWIWVLAGFVLLALELMTPGALIALFFGISAIAVGALTGAGVIESVWLQWACFSVLALGTLGGLRKPLQARLNLSGNTQAVDSAVGEQVEVVEEIPAGGAGRVAYRGTTWTARSRGSAAVPVGARRAVDAIEGLTLWLRAE